MPLIPAIIPVNVEAACGAFWGEFWCRKRRTDIGYNSNSEYGFPFLEDITYKFKK